MKKRKITGPIAAIVCTAIVALAATLIYAPEDVRGALLAAEGLAATLIAAYLRSPRDVIAPLVALGVLASAPGCTAADQQKAHGAFVDVLGVLKWACRGVGAVDSVHESIAPVTSGGEDEEPHTIDGEDP
jgi:hypothetical protein